MAMLYDDALRVYEWSRENSLNLNPGKTKLMFLGSHHFITNIGMSTIPPLIINGVLVESTDEISDLGCRITQNLNWGPHVRQVSSRVHRAIYSLHFDKKVLSHTLKRRLVEALIFPHLDYVCTVYNDLTREQNLTLDRLLNRCVRFVHASIPWHTPVTPYRLSLGWLSVEHRRMLLLATLAFSIVTTGQLVHLFLLFLLRTSDSNLRVSPRITPEPLLYPTPRTVTFENSFHITASKFIYIFADRLFSLDHTLIDHFKSLASTKLTAREVSDWRLRVSLDQGLVLNPLPHDTAFHEILNRVVPMEPAAV